MAGPDGYDEMTEKRSMVTIERLGDATIGTNELYHGLKTPQENVWILLS